MWQLMGGRQRQRCARRTQVQPAAFCWPHCSFLAPAGSASAPSSWAASSFSSPACCAAGGVCSSVLAGGGAAASPFCCPGSCSPVGGSGMCASLKGGYAVSATAAGHSSRGVPHRLPSRRAAGGGGQACLLCLLRGGLVEQSLGTVPVRKGTAGHCRLNRKPQRIPAHSKIVCSGSHSSHQSRRCRPCRGRGSPPERMPP